MRAGDDSNWDRSADLERISATYARYARAGRGRLWDRRSRGYARLADELDERLLSVLQRSVRADRASTVLDLGCGTGELAEHAAPLAKNWIGVDLRSDAVAQAQIAYPDLTFLCASADDLPLATGSIDVVVARVLFSSLPSAQLEAAVAAEISRVLCPGGWLVWLDIRYPNPSNSAVHGIDADRLRRLFPEWPSELQTAGLLPPLARRLGRLTGRAYPVLRSLPPLRSHLVGRLQRPDNAER